MAEKADLSGPSSEWNFYQAMFALTGKGIDLGSKTGAQWYTIGDGGEKQDDSATAGGGKAEAHGDEDLKDDLSNRVDPTADLYYQAFDYVYYQVNRNEQARDGWEQAVEDLKNQVEEMAKNKTGVLDLQTLRDAHTLVLNYEKWLKSSGEGFRKWANTLDSDASGFSGKAASVIQQRIDQNADKLEGLHDQLVLDRGLAASTALQGLVTKIEHTTQALAQAYYDFRDKVLYKPSNKMYAFENLVHDYLDNKGLLNNDNFHFKDKSWSGGDGVGEAEKYFRQSLTEFSVNLDDKQITGDIQTAAPWNVINKQITDALDGPLKELNTFAAKKMKDLDSEFQLVNSKITALEAPELTPSGGSGGPPPPGGGDGGGDDDLKDLFEKLGGGDGGGDGPPPPGGDDGGGNDDLKDVFEKLGGGEGGGDGPPPPGGDDGSANNFGGDGGADGQGGPGFVPPVGFSGGNGGGNGQVGPAFSGGDGGGNFGGDGGGDGQGGPGFVPPPVGFSGGNSNGGGKNDNRDDHVPPPGGHSDFNEPELKIPDPGASDGFGDRGDDSGNNPGYVPPPGSEYTGPGAEIPDPGASDGFGGGGSASFGGSGGSDGFGTPVGSDGSAMPDSSRGNGNAPAGSSTPVGFGMGGGGGTQMPPMPKNMTQLQGPTGPGAGGGMGGMPFMPPMGGMGGMGGAGGSQQERERQTWLSEDEDVWGTDDEAGLDVIGRPDAAGYEVEEQVAAGPVRPPRQPAKAPSEQEQTAAGQA